MTVLLTQWEVDHLAISWGTSEAEVLRRLGAINVDNPDSDPSGPCECKRMPWKPHRHRYTLGEGRA